MNLAGRREVRSFTRRERPLGQAALATRERLWERLAVPEEEWVGLGEGPRDVVLDIGFGDGESLLTMAAGDPGRDYFERPGLRLGHKVRDLRFRRAP